jgi:formamidopyrimidine-DNA glycosylase
MPELPEVETFRRRVGESALDRSIEHVRLHDADAVLDTSASTLRRHLLGERFCDAMRHGKYLFMGVDDGWLVLHFGMTGDVTVCPSDSPEPEYTKMRIDFGDGGFLAYVCVRKLGHIDWAQTIEQFVEDHEMGPDALDVDFDGFRQGVEGRTTAIKNVLMDQSVIAGVGNEYSDEILLRAGLRPDRATDDLDETQLRSIYDATRQILTEVVELLPDRDRLTGRYLVASRKEGAECPRCAGPIEKMRIGGRSAYFCPSCQK